LDIIRGLSALEQTLSSMGHPVQRGSAVAAAEAAFAGNEEGAGARAGADVQG
jgi:hypothetical protein